MYPVLLPPPGDFGQPATHYGGGITRCWLPKVAAPAAPAEDGMFRIPGDVTNEDVENEVRLGGDGR